MTDYEALKRIIDEIDILINKHVTNESPDFITWKTRFRRFLEKKYGKESDELSQFYSIRFSPYDYYSTEEQYIILCKTGLEEAKATFKVYLEELNEDVTTKGEALKQITFEEQNKKSDYSKIFIIHGHDEALKQLVARIIERQRIEAIILSEKVNQGKTIIEKIEANSNVGGAISLFTADDVGKASEETEEKARARQNVVLETGYFMGKLGREHVVIIAAQGIELPSDLQGIIYIDKSNWQLNLLKELKSIGYAIDYSKLDS
ncbi:MAG: hypothetical protein EOM87_02105 [Clostridia bacterium]|nr:hypothetical protein [Clostridia bacterium]